MKKNIFIASVMVFTVNILCAMTPSKNTILPYLKVNDGYINHQDSNIAPLLIPLRERLNIIYINGFTRLSGDYLGDNNGATIYYDRLFRSNSHKTRFALSIGAGIEGDGNGGTFTSFRIGPKMYKGSKNWYFVTDLIYYSIKERGEEESNSTVQIGLGSPVHPA